MLKTKQDKDSVSVPLNSQRKYVLSEQTAAPGGANWSPSRF